MKAANKIKTYRDVQSIDVPDITPWFESEDFLYSVLIGGLKALIQKNSDADVSIYLARDIARKEAIRVSQLIKEHNARMKEREINPCKNLVQG